MIQYLRENGFNEPITNEVLQRVQEDEHLMQRILGGDEVGGEDIEMEGENDDGQE